MITIDVRHGTKSYDIILKIFHLLNTLSIIRSRNVKVLDLTYGKGRFYRKLRTRYKTHIIGVDIKKHDWEIEPDQFYKMDMRVFTNKVINKEINLDGIDVIVIDPPWNYEKRGSLPRNTGITNMHYHMRQVRSYELIRHALKLHRYLKKPLIYRYKEPIENTTILIRHCVNILGNKGYVYYGIITNETPKTLLRYLNKTIFSKPSPMMMPGSDAW